MFKRLLTALPSWTAPALCSVGALVAGMAIGTARAPQPDEVVTVDAYLVALDEMAIALEACAGTGGAPQIQHTEDRRVKMVRCQNDGLLTDVVLIHGNSGKPASRQLIHYLPEPELLIGTSNPAIALEERLRVCSNFGHATRPVQDFKTGIWMGVRCDKSVPEGIALTSAEYLDLMQARLLACRAAGAEPTWGDDHDQGLIFTLSCAPNA